MFLYCKSKYNFLYSADKGFEPISFGHEPNMLPLQQTAISPRGIRIPVFNSENVMS